MGAIEGRFLAPQFGEASMHGFSFTNKTLFEPATRKYLPQLNLLHTSWLDTPPDQPWEYQDVVRAAYQLIRADNLKADGSPRLDYSDVDMFLHCNCVADDSFRLAKLMGFDDKEATTVWIAALCHDYLENAKNEVDLADRTKKLAALFKNHDHDILNLVVTLTDFDPTRLIPTSYQQDRRYGPIYATLNTQGTNRRLDYQTLRLQ